ncbi:MAG TPA: class I SAM-dependent methyltransferase [Terriglobales bacterium]|nr:class I SAM-dependent methyltransferase [Terriglobales bacterium]
MLTISQIRNRTRLAFSLATLPVKLSLPAPRKLESSLHFALNEYAIKSIQVPFEIARFVEIAKSLNPKRVVEIGTSLGGTLYLLCRIATPDATLVSVDLPAAANGDSRSWLSRPFFRMFAKDRQRVVPLRADSHSQSTREQVQRILPGGKTDLLFIDGDHSYDGVKRDFELYSPLVRDGGIIAMHDIARHQYAERDNCYVDVFWNEIKHRYRSEEIIERQDQGWAGIGILYV